MMEWKKMRKEREDANRKYEVGKEKMQKQMQQKNAVKNMQSREKQKYEWDDNNVPDE